MILSQISYIILAAVIITAIINLYINNIVNNRNLFGKLQNVYLFFIIFHSLYVCIVRSFFSDDYYLDIGFPFILFYPPFYYLAIYTLDSPQDFKMKKMRMHFYPGLAFLLFFIIIYVFFRENLKLKLSFCYMIYGIGCIMFIIYSIVSYIKSNKNVQDNAAANLMRRSLILAVTIILVFSALHSTGRGQIHNHFNGVVIYILMFLTVVVLFGYNFSVLQKKITDSNENFPYITGAERDIETIETEKQIPLNSDLSDGKYKRSRITEEEIQYYLVKLHKTLDEKIYLDSELTLEKLAKQLHISKYNLTQVLNLGLKINFNKLINQYRIEYAEKLLCDKENDFTIEEIVMASGFNSRSSFYRSFNLYFKMSPADYQKKFRKL